MRYQNRLAEAASELARVVRVVEPRHLAAPTPCRDYTVHGLLNHLLAWSPIIEAAALRTSTSGRPDETTDHVTGNWRDELLGWLDRIVAGWQREAALSGMVDLGGTEVPAAVIADKTMCEHVLHGWDLARSVGVPFRCSDEVVSIVHDSFAQNAEQTRRLGMFAPPVTVAPAATPLERLLGASGRDLNWPLPVTSS